MDVAVVVALDVAVVALDLADSLRVVVAVQGEVVVDVVVVALDVAVVVVALDVAGAVHVVRNV